MDKVEMVFIDYHHTSLVFVADEVVVTFVQVLEILQLYGLLIVAAPVLDITDQMGH